MKLSIGMMVKNESKYLRKCLESLKPIRDSIETELIIVDTGSTDNTVEIAKEFTDKVYFHEWNSNFSEIRNITIKYSTGEWFFYIDGDEIINNPKGILEFFNSEEIKKYNTASITIKNFTSINNDEEFTIFTAVRIFKKDMDFHFDGAIHNQPIWKSPMIKLSSELSHYGYINNDKELMDKKFLRTSGILKTELEKSPGNIYYIYQLAVSYAMHGDHQEALETIKKAYNLVKLKMLDLNKYMYVSIFLAKMYLTIGKFREAETICLEATKKEGFYIDLYYYLAKAQFSTYKNEEAIGTYNKYFKKLEDFNNFKVADDLSIIDYTLGSHDYACLDMAILYERIGKYEKALEFIKKIKSDKVLNSAFKICISLFAKQNKFEELRAFCYDIYTNHNSINDYFISALELYLVKANKQVKENIFKVFSEGDTDYALLNKIRLTSDNAYSNLSEEITKLNFSNLPDYFADILYSFLCDKVSFVKLMEGVNDFKIKNYCNYLILSHEDFVLNIYAYLKSYENAKLSLEEVRIYKILAVYLFKDKTVNNEQYSEILDKYLEVGEQYLSKIYSEDILQNECFQCMKDEEDLFLMYMYFANKNINSQVTYVRYLRKALNACNYMEKGINILSDKVKEDLKQNDNEMDLYKTKVKKNITQLIEGNQLEEATILINEYEDIIKDDFEIYSMKAVVAIMENRIEDAEKILVIALDTFKNNFDLNYNLGYVYEQMNDYNKAIKYYNFAEQNCDDLNIKIEIQQNISKIKVEHGEQIKPDKKKIVFFDKGDDKFIGDIINKLSKEYETKHIRVTNYKQIDEGMQWADICWFEWCDELVAYGSKNRLAKEKKIICRLHRYEAFTNYIQDVNWDNIDKVIFVAKHIRDVVINKVKLTISKCEVIPNGINLDKFQYHERKKGFNLAWIGYLNLRKNPMIVIQYFNELVKKDSRYQLYLAGSFQDEALFYYINDMIKKLNIEDNVHFDGLLPNDKMSKWLSNKDYIVTGSIAEGHPVGVMEAMASGLKPVIHYFPGVETFYPKEYIYYDLNDFIRIMMKDNYDSKDYRKYIEDNYSLSKQIGDIRSLVKSININNQSLINIKSKNKNMKISYLMPVYNGENFIKKSLDSILNQKIKPFEIIVIDDNSTDNSYKILKDYSKKYPNIKLIRNKDNLGEAKNTANLINIARGDFIKILHQDDWLYEDYSTVISNIDNIDEFSFVINDFTYIINNNVINNYLKKAWDSFNINPNELKKEELQKVLVILGNYLGGPSNILFNRKKLLNINYLEEFDSNGGYARDYYTFIKLISINKPLFIFLDLSYRYEHTENATSKYIASLKRVSGLHKILKKFEHILNEDEKEIAYKNLFGKAIYSIDNCKDKQEKEKMIQYILKNYKYLPREQEVELVKKLDFN